MQESSKLCCREILLRHEHPRLRVNTSSRAGFDLDTRLLAPEESREKKKKISCKNNPFWEMPKVIDKHTYHGQTLHSTRAPTAE